MEVNHCPSNCYGPSYHNKEVLVYLCMHTNMLYNKPYLCRYGKSGRPEACPISSLDAALNWVPGCDDLCVPSISLPTSLNSTADPSMPRMLVCHDMMGGYKKDRFVQGHRYV